MDAFKGKWERTSAENYEELLKVSKAVFFTLLFIDPLPPQKNLFISFLVLSSLLTFPALGGFLPSEKGGHRFDANLRDHRGLI